MGERRTFRRDPEARPRVGERRRLVPQGLEKPGDAVAAVGGADEDRHHMPFLQFAGEVVENTVAGRLDLRDELLHERIVVIGKPLEHGEARLALARKLTFRHIHNFAWRVLPIDEGALKREVDEADRNAVLPDRDLPQEKRRPGRALQKFQRLAHAPRAGVDLVDEKEPRDVRFFQLPQHHFKGRDLALVRLANDDGGVASRSGGAHVVLKFD